jgi:hypothetical protein
MEPQRSRRSPYMAISVVFGVAWIVAAWARPEVNYVLFPLLIAGSLPVIYRLTLGRAVPTQFATAAAIAGIINAVVIAAFLAISGRLQGPTVMAVGGHVVDAAVWATIGAAFGVFAASWKGRSRRDGDT